MQDDNKLKVIHSDGYIDFFKPRLIKEQLLSETDISEEDANKIQRRVSEKLRKLDIDEVSTSTIRAEVSAQLTSRGLLKEEKDSRILGMSVKEFEHLLENGCNDNANIHYSPEMITKYAYDSIAKQYALQDMPEHCAKAHMDGFVHHHDLEFFHTRPNCINNDLRFFAKNGLMIDGKGLMGSVAKPAKTLEVILNHMLQAWMAGAVVFSGGQGYVNFNTLLAPYARGRSYEEIKQAIQGFIFNCNMSLVCRGGQILFSSIGVDLSVPKVLANEPAIGPGGIANGVYADYQEEADLIFRAILEVSEEKDGMGAYHRFPNCYASNTPIAIKKNDIIKITTIGDFVDSCIDKKCNKYFDSKVSFETQGYEILSWNTLNNYPEWKPIVTAIRNPNQDIYEVTTKKGLKMHVTKQHPFMNINGGRIKNLDKGKPLNEFKTYDRLVKLNTPILSYNENKIGTFIGFFLGDGSVDKTSKNNRILFTLYKKEKFDYLINLLDEIGFNYKNRGYIDSKDSNKIEYNISLIDTKQNDKQLSEIIKDCVLMKNSFLLDKYNNSHYYLGLLSGLINSDGSIQVNKTIDKPSIILKFSNTNTELIDLFINIGNLYGLNISKKIKQTPISNNHCLCYDLFVGGINMINLLSHISLHKIHEDKFLSLNTKYVPQNCYNSSSIKSIEPIQYEGFTYDLEVADNHNYFAGQGNVLSHNCLFNIREGDLDEYSGNCKLLHEKGCNNPTLYYVNCTEMERTVMGCLDGDEGIWCKIKNNISYKTFYELSDMLNAQYGVTPVEDIEVLTIDDDKNIIWHKVSNFIKNKDQQMYKITLQGNKSFICDENHGMITFKGLNKKSILDCTKGSNLIDVNCKDVNVDFDIDYKSVLMGFWLGDGVKNLNYGQIVVSKEDKKEFLESIFQKANIEYSLTHKTRPIDNRHINPNIYNFKFNKSDLNNMDVDNFDLHDINVCAGLLSGMLSSDGYIRCTGQYTNSLGAEFVSTNFDISRLFKYCCFMTGLKFSSTIKEKQKAHHNDFERIYISCNESTIHTLTQLCLRPKQMEIVNQFDEDMFRSIKPYKNQRVLDIELLDKRDSFCLEVNGRMIIGSDFILTSQCRTALPANYTGDYQKDSMNTGNFMYSTLNLPLIALQAKENAKESGKSLRQEFYNLLGDMCDIIYDTLIYRRECIIDTIYNKKMSNFLLQTDKETGEPLWDIDRTTITIGYCGLYECLQILENEDGEAILNFINSKKELYHEKDGLRWSVIGSPAESASHRFAEIIKEKYPDAPVQGIKGSYYLTNSSHIPVSKETDIIDHIKNAAKYHPLSLGGNILHIWSGEVWSDPQAIWSLNKKILETGVIFWAYSKVFTHCPECGYTINDNLEVCPICGSTHLYLYDRITGYYLGIETFNNGKKQEFKDRYRQKI